MPNDKEAYQRNEFVDPPLKVRGSLFLQDDICAASVDVFGHLSTQGAVSTAALKVSGNCMIRGSCKAHQVNNLGSLRIQNIQADNLSSSGYLSVAQDAVVGTFYADGAVKIKHLTISSSLEIRLSSRSSVEVISADGNIIVKPNSRLMNALMPPFRRLTCQKIEGISITLQQTTAELVCGEDIVIGPRCTIREIHYSKSLTIDPKSQVDRTVFLQQ